MEIISKIIDFLNDKFSFPVAIFCILLLTAPDWTLERLNLLVFVDSANDILSLIFLFSTILYLYGRGKKLSRYIKKKTDERTKRNTRRKIIATHVKGLTKEEKLWVFFCLREKVLTLYATDVNETAVALESKRLIYRPKSVYDKSATPFTFYPEVWRYLSRRKEKFCPREELKDRKYNERLDQFIKNLRNTT